ncbi:MAG: tRNA lysidine(34) synthetase TilS [Candidatus Gracilibacteria bacterium]|nr:tRNA lysidine(34) synthetase TilS [Candidatus Gracilibacteria bacterium]
MLNLTPFLQKYFSPDEPIILACSTGPDSMFLLYKILETSYKDNLVACYFNHKLRPESDSEEKFLEDLGKKHGFKVEIAEADIKKIQKLYPSKSIEELAREKRYAFFDAILHIYNAKHILTAHHLDDKLETFLFNLSRGSKLTGLINMTESSGAILRPLLDIEKKDILTYLEKNKLPYTIDSTNEETEFTRNYIRHEILPKFERLNSNYKQNINNIINYFEDLKSFIDEEVKNFLQKFSSEKLKVKSDKYFGINEFNSLSPFLQKEVIRYIYYISNGNSTIGLSEANIAEVIKFINGKGNKTVKQIRNMKLKKDNKIILY